MLHVIIVSFDGAEVCEFLELCILSALSRKYREENIGVYRYDGLANFRHILGQEAGRIRKIYESIQE